MEDEEEAIAVSGAAGALCGLSSIFLTLVVLEQLEKYYRFTFKEKTPRFLFPALKTWHSSTLFISSLVLLVVTVTNDDSHGTILICNRLIMLEGSFLYVSICVLFQRCFGELTSNIRKAAENASSAKQKKKLKNSIKQINKLRLATFTPAGVAIVLLFSCGMIPQLYRVGWLAGFIMYITVELCILAMQLDYFRRAYTKQMKKIARTLKELERRGVKLESKWAKIKAYATQSSVAPVSIVPTRSPNDSKPILLVSNN
jgi:hypothetical protein